MGGDGNPAKELCPRRNQELHQPEVEHAGTYNNFLLWWGSHRFGRGSYKMCARARVHVCRECEEAMDTGARPSI